MQKCYPGKLARQPCAAMPDKGFAVRDGPAARRLPMPCGTSPCTRKEEVNIQIDSDVYPLARAPCCPGNRFEHP